MDQPRDLRSQSASKTADGIMTDSTIVSIQVLALPSQPEKSDHLYVPGQEDPTIKDSKRRFSLFKRKPSTSDTPVRKPSNTQTTEHTVKEMTYGEYLKYYALDDYGRYIGTEDPAPDCILRDASDVARFKMPPEYRDLLGDPRKMDRSPVSMLSFGPGAAMAMSPGGF